VRRSSEFKVQSSERDESLGSAPDEEFKVQRSEGAVRAAAAGRSGQPPTANGQRPTAKRQEPRASLRPLALPRPVQVRTDAAGLPVEVELTRTSGQWPAASGQRPTANGQRRPQAKSRQTVARVEEVWRVAEEWWREEPVARTYYRLVLDDGRPLTLFHDDEGAGGGWFSQHYG